MNSADASKIADTSPVNATEASDAQFCAPSFTLPRSFLTSCQMNTRRGNDEFHFTGYTGSTFFQPPEPV
jgi:hypothetical protein